MAYVLLIGGARSGKSAAAVRLAGDSGIPVTFIATAVAGDDEMAERIRRHRDARPRDWSTIEAPLDLIGAIRSAPRGDFLVIECLTLWVANLLGEGAHAGGIDAAADEIVQALQDRRGVVVTNEVGLGIVPVNRLARGFRDVLGSVNARFASSAERAVLLVAGRAVDLHSIGSVLGPP